MPALPVVFTRRAARQVEACGQWWRLNRPEASSAPQEELTRALALVAVHPGCGVPIAIRKFRGVRRLHLTRIDYHLYYRLVPGLQRLEVIAFWHARRGSGPTL